MNIERISFNLEDRQYDQSQLLPGSRDGFRSVFDNAMRTRKSAVELHFSDEEDSTALGATANEDFSVTVYRPLYFDMLSPSYTVRVWDADGAMSERSINLDSVDPRNADFCEMFAYSCYLTDSEIDEDAQNTFMIMTAEYRSMGMRTDKRLDWLELAGEAMQSHYRAGNFKEYMDIRLYLDNFSETL